MGVCLKALVSLPNLPFTVTILAFTSTSTPSGTSRSCSATMYFMTNNYSKKQYLINIQQYRPALSPFQSFLSSFSYRLYPYFPSPLLPFNIYIPLPMLQTAPYSPHSAILRIRMVLYFIMAKGQLCIKAKSEAVRWMLNCVVMVSVFKNPALMEHICGPFTLPVADKQHLIVFIMWIEVVRITYKGLLNLANRLPFLRWIPSYLEDLLTVKYLLVLALKIFLIFEDEHRKKFYLHSFLLEGIILLTAILFDCLQKQNIKDAGELLLIDALHRLSLVYELTQTFCPNLILYYVVTNLLVFVMVQVESQLKQGLKASLYVKHDVYRFMFMTVLFFGLASLAQLASLNFKMLVTFLLCLKFLLAALKEYSESNQGAALNHLVVCGVILSLCEVVFLWVPFSLGTGQL